MRPGRCSRKPRKPAALFAALEQNIIQRKVAATRAAREANIAKRRDVLTGASEFPNLHEADIAVLDAKPVVLPSYGEAKIQVRRAAHRCGSPRPSRRCATSRTPDEPRSPVHMANCDISHCRLPVRSLSTLLIVDRGETRGCECRLCLR